MILQRALHRITVSQEDWGQRLDQVIPCRISSFSRTLARKIIDLGGVHVDGRRTRKCSLILEQGQLLEVHVDGLPLEPFVLSEEHIIFRDKFLIAINKPSGVDTQPTHARYKGTLYEALKKFLADPSRPHLDPELGMAQRLDRETSGVLVFSTHLQSHKGLSVAISERKVEKVYLAVVQGIPQQEKGQIRSYLARARHNNLMKSVERGGKEAITNFRFLRAFPELSCALLEVRIPTGRSHQIRVHMAESGHPLVGDVRYGGPSCIGGCEISRQMLHSWLLNFTHPVSGEALSLEAPIPPDMEKFVPAERGII